ncbi:hypothetical protein MMC24_004608 [Lignoscripta atroalba]|nr:hypothetical protein [Lignoscripta atroalba]
MEKRDKTDERGVPVEAIVIGILGLFFTGGSATIGAQIAAASLRLTTMTAYTAIYGGAAVGTGYVVVESGRLVVRRTRPGILRTIEAANMVAREARAQAAAASGTVALSARAVSSGIVETAQAVADASTDVVSQVVDALTSHLPDVPARQDLISRQEQVPVVIISPEETQEPPEGVLEDASSAHFFISCELLNGMIELQRFVREGDLGDVAYLVPDYNLPVTAVEDEEHSSQNVEDEADVTDTLRQNDTEDKDGFVVL